MAADLVVSSELKSLQDELLSTQRERAAALPAQPATPPLAPAESANEAAEESELRNQLRDLVSEVTGFFEEAEKGIATHPVQSVIGALLAGILIGRLLGRH
jgi:hypothetical protein